MQEIITLLWILLIWSIVGLIATIICKCSNNFIGLSIGLDYLNPIYIYKHVKVNWFGCIWLTLLVNLMCPPLTVAYWFYNLCIVGRD